MKVDNIIVHIFSGIIITVLGGLILFFIVGHIKKNNDSLDHQTNDQNIESIGDFTSDEPNSETITERSNNPRYEDYCASFNSALTGVFSTKSLDGTMIWIGGMNGKVEIAGDDYNDMTCTYNISDCKNGIINMNCNGQEYDTIIELFSADSIRIGEITYIRDF